MTAKEQQAESYLARGVSPTKDEVKAAVKNQDKGLFPGAFCKLLPDPAGDPAYCFALHADGAGTKSSLAYLMFRETGDYRYFSDLAQDSLVMNTDDLACIGATDGFILSNTIGRNAHRIDGHALAVLIEGYERCAVGLKAQGVGLTLAGGETADVGDLVQTLIADSTVACRLPREEVISAAALKPGLAIVGLASFGQAVYESRENSGIGSNGLTAARHVLLKHVYAAQYPETFASTTAEEKVYAGRFLVDDQLPGSALCVGDALLSPTRTYLPILKPLLRLYRERIFALIHCTGGGQAKCRDFGSGIRFVKDNLFAPPPLFEAIYASGEVPAREMYQIFNMGHRMEIYCDEAAVASICALSESFGVEAARIGYTEASQGETNEVVIQSPWGTFSY